MHSSARPDGSGTRVMLPDWSEYVQMLSSKEISGTTSKKLSVRYHPAGAPPNGTVRFVIVVWPGASRHWIHKGIEPSPGIVSVAGQFRIVMESDQDPVPGPGGRVLPCIVTVTGVAPPAEREAPKIWPPPTKLMFAAPRGGPHPLDRKTQELS